MLPFDYQRAQNVDSAVDSLHAIPSAKILAGGTNLVDLMRQSIEKPSLIIDINHLDLAEITELPDGGLRLGALARNADTANHPLVRQRYPMLARAILSGASPQLRNLATNGGNLLQRTRCYYFYDPAFPQCNKRNPGSGCGAVHGFNRIHAILGASPSCIASHPSDMCVALSALEARVRVQGPDGKEREIPFHEFHRLPGETPHIDTTLMPDELILSINLPVSPYGAHSCYLKVRDRASYAFALVSVAAAIALDDQIVSSARLSLGGVAHKPWRAESAEQTLVGKPLTMENLRLAADEALAGAQPYRFNAFKVETAKRAIVRAFLIAAGPDTSPKESTHDGKHPFAAGS